MSEDHEQPYESETGGNAPDHGNHPMRRGWFFYIAGFFLVLAGVCFVLSNSFNYQPGPLPPRPPAESTGSGK